MRFPQLALTGQTGGAQVNISDMSFNPYATFVGAAALTAPLYNASALGYHVKVAEARGNQAIAHYRKTILQAFQEVEDALISVQKTREQREAQNTKSRLWNRPCGSLNFATKAVGPAISIS